MTTPLFWNRNSPRSDVKDIANDFVSHCWRHFEAFAEVYSQRHIVDDGSLIFGGLNNQTLNPAWQGLVNVNFGYHLHMFVGDFLPNSWVMSTIWTFTNPCMMGDVSVTICCAPPYSIHSTPMSAPVLGKVPFSQLFSGGKPIEGSKNHWKRRTVPKCLPVPGM